MFPKGIQHLKSVLKVIATHHSLKSPLGTGNPGKTVGDVRNYSLFGVVLVLLCDLILVFALNH